MSTRPESMPPLVEPSIFEVPTPLDAPPLPAVPSQASTPLGNPRRFAEEQMRRLVQQVFCPGWPRPAKQVVIAGVDEDADVSSICLQVGQALSDQVEASICVVELNLHDAEVEEYRERGAGKPEAQPFGSLRGLAHQVSTNLWHVSSPAFMDEQNGISARWLRTRLADLRLEFDYAVLHGPPAGTFSETAVIGSLTDGIVLVLEADSTRRVVAQKTRDALHAANVRILGAVLNDRVFPIPPSIYDRL